MARNGENDKVTDYMKRRDKHNLLFDPVEVNDKAQKEREIAKKRNEARYKGTGRITRADHRRPEDL
jgi:hypothetical protein